MMVTLTKMASPWDPDRKARSRLQQGSRSHSVKDGPLLRQESEYRDIRHEAQRG